MQKFIRNNISKLKFFCYYLIEKIFLIITGNWKAFYGWYLDRQDYKKTAHQMIELGKKKRKSGFDKGLYDTSMGEYHLKFMRAHGLKPTDKVFELGFGFGRTAIPLIKYLKKDGYAGSEISKERLRIASEWIGLEDLTTKNPKLVFALDNSFAFIDSESVDFIWAQSVFTHLPEAEFKNILKNLRPKLSTSGVLLFNYTISDDEGYKRNSIKDFAYTSEKVTDIGVAAGFAVEDVVDWQSELNERSRAKHNKMVKLTAQWR